MKRKTLDKVFAAGGLVVAILLAVLGYAVWTQASFASGFVKDELSAQKITFPTADKLTAEEKSWKPSSTCLIDFAGQTMQTGAQAQCYANNFIALHMETSATNAGYPGATYATIGTAQGELRAQIAAAKAKNDNAAADAAQKKLDAATALRTTLQTGDTLRGLLLTTYGFSVLGDIAALAAWVMAALAVVMFGLSVAGFGHAALTPEDEVVFAPTPEPRRNPLPA